MRARRIAPVLTLPFALALGGCGYVHVGKLPPPAPATVIGDEKLMQENSDLKLEKKMLQQELALTRAQGEALRTAIENRAADGDTSKRLVEKLNETSKELAALRAGYTQLQAERNRAVASAAESDALRRRLGAAEEQLATSLRGYTELQEEIGRLRTDVARTRDENLALTEQVKVVTAQNEQAQAALAQLNTDLLAQKDARLRAEQDATTLRTELTAVAPNSSALAQQRTGAAAEARSLIAEHAAETAALKQQLDELRTKVAALDAERTELSRRAGPAPELADVEAKLVSALRSAQMLRDENSRLKTTGEQLATQLKQLSTGSPAVVQTQTLREQLRETQAQAQALTEENARLKARLASPEVVDAARPDVISDPKGGPARVVIGGPAETGLPVRPSGVNATLVTSAGATRPPTAPADPGAAGRTHTVAGGDTLAKISNRYYGTPARWADILAANRDVLGEGNNLVVGRTLRIP